MAILFPVSASANIIAEYKRCVDQRVAEAERPRVVEAYRDSGCTTGKTSFDGARKSCNQTVCWNAPPNNLIVDAKVWDHAASGSEHSFTATQYLPSRDFATSICNTVQARSPSGALHGKRGWQKISADVTISRQITRPERDEIEAKCESEILGPR